MNWSLLPTISAPMPLQMALDELLLESQKIEQQNSVLRFYFSSAPWISVGCSFRDSAALAKSELILQNPQVPVCKRITGGGCVLHGEDLIFSLITRYERGQAGASKGNAYASLASAAASYGKIHEGVKMGLELCGLDPKFYGAGDITSQGSDCFSYPVESDLSWKGKKIAGGAQKRSEGVLLHHESIRVPPGVARGDLIRELRKGLAQVFGVTIENADLDSSLFFNAMNKKDPSL
ncbi:MAG: hypothetical protein V1882_03230 [Candidatus Omnitrophota bacterium]